MTEYLAIEEIILALESECDEYPNRKAVLPKLLQLSIDGHRQSLADLEMEREANKELTGLLSKKYQGKDDAIQKTMARLKKKGAG